MLHVEMHDSIKAFIIRLQGGFTGEGADHLRTLVPYFPREMRLVIDLTETTFVDAVGEEVLVFLRRLGAVFMGETPYSQDVCDRLHLPLVRKPRSQKHMSELQEECPI